MLRLYEKKFTLQINAFDDIGLAAKFLRKRVNLTFPEALRLIRQGTFPIPLPFHINQPILLSLSQELEQAQIHYTFFEIPQQTNIHAPIFLTTFHGSLKKICQCTPDLNQQMPDSISRISNYPGFLPAYLLHEAAHTLQQNAQPDEELVALHHRDGSWSFTSGRSDASRFTQEDIRQWVAEELDRREPGYHGKDPLLTHCVTPELIEYSFHQDGQKDGTILLWRVAHFGGYEIGMNGIRRCALCSNNTWDGSWVGDLIQAFEVI